MVKSLWGIRSQKAEIIHKNHFKLIQKKNSHPQNAPQSDMEIMYEHICILNIKCEIKMVHHDEHSHLWNHLDIIMWRKIKSKKD